MNANDFRRMVLLLPGVVESSHMDHPDFRIDGKIVATLGFPDDTWAMVKLTPDQQNSLVAADAKAFSPCNGTWGQRGCTNVRLAAAKKSLVRLALEMAAENMAPSRSAGAKRKPVRRGDSPADRNRMPSRSAIARIQRRVTKAVESLPAAAAVDAGSGHYSLEVRGKRFGWLLIDHHGDGRVALSLKSAPGVSKTLSARQPDFYHIPKYVGHHGWIGLWLDGPSVDWDQVLSAITAAYRLTAPGSLLDKLTIGS
jgi:hypothetical protein